MDKTLDRDLENLSWRLIIHQCNLIKDRISNLQQENISQEDIITHCAKDIRKIDQIIISIARFQIDEGLSVLSFLDVMEENLELRDSLDKETLIKNLIAHREYCKTRIDNKPIK